MKILHVDDDIDDHDFFRIAIRKIDPTIYCVHALDGDHALSILKNDKSDLPNWIFLDINMPRMDGKQCLEEIKRNRNLRHIPVVMLSTLSEPTMIRAYIELGAVDFITKPNSVGKLAEDLKRVMGL